MPSRRRSSGVGPYVVLGGGALLLVALGLLTFALRGRIGALFARERGEASAAGAADASPSSQKQSAIPVVKVRSEDLREQYAQDESAADGKFKDRPLEITGTITAVLREAPVGIIFGKPQDMTPAVVCELDRKQGEEVLSRLRAGMTVTVRGTGMGKIQGGFIGVGNCRIISQ
jgi:hypothetical protein